MTHTLKDKIVEVLNAHLNNYWHSISDTTKAIIAEQIVKIISANPPVISSVCDHDYTDPIYDRDGNCYAYKCQKCGEEAN